MTWTRGPARGAPTAWDIATKGANVVVSGNLATVASGLGSVRTTRSRNTGSPGVRYAELTIGGADGRSLYGLGSGIADLSNYPGSDINGFAYYGFNGILYSNGSSGFTNATYGTGDVMGVSMDGLTVLFYKNGSVQSFGWTLSSGDYYVMWGPGDATGGPRSSLLNVTGPFLYLPSGALPWED